MIVCGVDGTIYILHASTEDVPGSFPFGAAFICLSFLVWIILFHGCAFDGEAIFAIITS